MSRMRELPLRELIGKSVTAHGALAFDKRDSGIGPRRLPDWTRIQLPPRTDVMARMPSGVRLRFTTDSPRVGLSFLATSMLTPPQERRPNTFNLETASGLAMASSTVGNTVVLNPDDPDDYTLQRGKPDTVVFDGITAGEPCELWLPHNSLMELRSLLVDEAAQVMAAEPDPRPRWIHHGSSISHCMEADEPAQTWPAVAARIAGACVQNLGLAGECHLDGYVARTIRDSDADLISLKVGINVVNGDTMRERAFFTALHGFLDTVREGKPETPLVLISPIHCPCAEDHPGPTVPNDEGKYVTIPGGKKIREGCLTLKRVRALMARIVEKRREQGDTQLQYLDGLSLFGEADAADLPDDLHPNPAGYIRMGERFADQVLGELVARVR